MTRQAPLGFTFTETMGGPISAASTDERTAAADGRRTRGSLRFVVAIVIDDLAAFRRDPEHTAAMTGTVTARRFGGRREIERGVFNLFARDERGRRQMRYRLWFTGADGVRYRLQGYKDVYNDHVIDLWSDTTTLFTRIFREDAGGDEQVAAGVLRIRPLDLVPQVLSMRGLNARGIPGHLVALARFGLFFGSNVAAEYARPGGRLLPAPGG